MQQPQQLHEGVKKEVEKSTEEKAVIKVRREKEVPEEVKVQKDGGKKDSQIIEKTIRDLEEAEHQPQN